MTIITTGKQATSFSLALVLICFFQVFYFCTFFTVYAVHMRDYRPDTNVLVESNTLSLLLLLNLGRQKKFYLFTGHRNSRKSVCKGI